MLQQAKGDYDAGQYTLAITGFEQMIKTFPDTEAAVEAQYWIGESQLYLNHFAEAIAAFNQALAKSPRFMYAPDALYKRGNAQERLLDSTSARTSYEQVIKQFPQSATATLAQQRLSRLAPAPGTTPVRR
jgi:tol-pal system protein YbgF